MNRLTTNWLLVGTWIVVAVLTLSGAVSNPKCFIGSSEFTHCLQSQDHNATHAAPVQYYFYNTTSRTCVSYSCNATNATIQSSLFGSLEQCRSACSRPLLGGCSSTRFGCCPDGLTSRADQNDPCQLDSTKQSSGGGLTSTHVVAIAVSVTAGAVLLLLVVAVVSIVVVWRRKKKRNEERVVNNLLRLYEDAYDSSSDNDDDSEEDYDSARLL